MSTIDNSATKQHTPRKLALPSGRSIYPVPSNAAGLRNRAASTMPKHNGKYVVVVNETQEKTKDSIPAPPFPRAPPGVFATPQYYDNGQIHRESVPAVILDKPVNDKPVTDKPSNDKPAESLFGAVDNMSQPTTSPFSMSQHNVPFRSSNIGTPYANPISSLQMAIDAFKKAGSYPMPYQQYQAPLSTYNLEVAAQTRRLLVLIKLNQIAEVEKVPSDLDIVHGVIMKFILKTTDMYPSYTAMCRLVFNKFELVTKSRYAGIEYLSLLLEILTESQLCTYLNRLDNKRKSRFITYVIPFCIKQKKHTLLAGCLKCINVDVEYDLPGAAKLASKPEHFTPELAAIFLEMDVRFGAVEFSKDQIEQITKWYAARNFDLMYG